MLSLRSRHRSAILILGPALLGAVAVACEDASPGGAPANVDGGLLDVGGGGTPDAGTTDPGNTDGGDSGTPNGTNILEPVTCAAPLRIDTLRGVNTSTLISPAYAGNRWMVLWSQLAGVSGDAKDHLKARGFDGTALLAEQDVATDQVFVPPLPTTVDGTGRGFTQFLEPTQQHVTIDFATGTFTKTPFASVTNVENPAVIAPIAAGGALSVYRTATGVESKRWDSGSQSWIATNLTGPAQAPGLTVMTNASGKGAATWYASDGAGGSNLTVAYWNGATWTNTTRAFPLDGGLSPSSIRHVVLSNGDVRFLWQVGARYLKTTVFHPSAAAGSEWDAPSIVEDVGTSATLAVPMLVADGTDRITVGWLEQGNVWVRRGSGGTWTDAVDLGQADSFSLTLDPFANVAMLIHRTSDKIGIARSPAGGTAWSPRVPVGAGMTNGSAGRTAGLAFDASGRPTIITAQENIAGPGLGVGLVYVSCR